MCWYADLYKFSYKCLLIMCTYTYRWLPSKHDTFAYNRTVARRWAKVCDAGPALSQNPVKVSCLLGLKTMLEMVMMLYNGFYFQLTAHLVYWSLLRNQTVTWWRSEYVISIKSKNGRFSSKRPVSCQKLVLFLQILP